MVSQICIQISDFEILHISHYFCLYNTSPLIVLSFLRYESGRYESYEQMLAAMEQNNDPFHDPPPPRSSQMYKDDDIPDRFKPNPTHPPPQGLSHRERSKVYDEEKRKRRKKKRKAPNPDSEGVLNETYTRDQNERRNSNKSTGTYTVDNDNKELLPPSPAKSSDGGYLKAPEEAMMLQTARSMEYGYMTHREEPEVNKQVLLCFAFSLYWF